MTSIPAPSVRADLRLWGKSKGLNGRPYPLAFHLLDTAAMSAVLWDTYLTPGIRTFISDALHMSDTSAKISTAFWAGLHDIGKVMDCFQSMDPDARLRLTQYPNISGEKIRHEAAAHVWLGHALQGIGYDGTRPHSAAFLVAQLLGGHHGRFLPRHSRECRAPQSVLPELGDGEWEQQRQAIFEVVHATIQPPQPPGKIPVSAATLICGLIVLADWLASQESHLLQRLDENPADDLASHYQRSLEVAPSLITAAGLTPVQLRSGSFAEEFPEIEVPYALQSSVSANLPDLLGGGPGLLIVTAPMGEGKTETAFHGARLLGAASGCRGFFVGLPTMATADQMYGRARSYGQRQAKNDASLTLLHSMSWLNDAYSSTGTDTSVLTDDADLSAPEWLHGRKRGLLASLAVGTIDQALLAALPLKHSMLRMLGLSGKVLIIDEAHTYDRYMQSLLETALAWLGHFGVPAVVMSATLPSTTAGRLAEAYLRGAGHPNVKVGNVPYPGWAYADGRTGRLTCTAVTSRSRNLRLDLRQTTVRDGSLDRLAVLMSLLSPLAEGGGSALVVCNTVRESQETYVALRSWFDNLPDEPPDLSLLHARFPARRREELTQDVIRAFGRCRVCPTLSDCEHRPRAAVLVATQVVEQSLDLDFDLVISDLAPIALLLQRAGRCWRHDGRRRPTWATGPCLVVLRPTQAGDLALPQSWPFVYHRALLRRTDDELIRIGQDVIAIPGHIQGLVEKVYDESLVDDDDIDRMATEMASLGLAEMVSIAEPTRVQSLHMLTSADVDEEMITTRLGADSMRLLCVFPDQNGSIALRPGGPALRTTGKLNRVEVKEILAESIPIRTSILRGRTAANLPPENWQQNAWLRDLVILHMTSDRDHSAVGLMGDKVLSLDEALGLEILR